MKTYTVSEAKSDICRIIREAGRDGVLITRHGRPAALVIGFQDEDDWFGYRIEHDEGFLRRIAKARRDIHEGRFVPLDDLPD